MSLILEAVKKALTEGEATVNLKEASTLTGSGSGVGGRVIYDDAFATLRMANPLRMMSRVVTTTGSDEAFVVKKGNATLIQSGTDNPWGYSVKSNVGDESVAFWQISLKDINVTVPVREAVMADIDNLEEALVADIALEFAQQEGLSMVLNNDLTTGTATPQTGQASGLRGLNFYAGSTSAAAWGSNGSSTAAGRHTMLEVAQATATAITYDEIAELASALPAQYWNLESTAWMMHPTTIQYLRELKDDQGLPVFLDIGEKDGFSIGHIFGHPVVANPYMDEIGSGKYPIYLAAWDRFVTIVDNEEMKITRLEQAQPGFITLFCEKRVCSTIRDVYAGVRLAG
jgi:HK97 family phage major capsid protein